MVPRRSRLFAVILVFAARRVCAQTASDTDLQLWNQIGVAWQLNPPLALVAWGQLRAEDDVSSFNEQIFSTGVVYTPWRWLSAHGGYLYDRNQNGTNHENRIYVSATFIAPAFHGFLLSDRVAAEMRWISTPGAAEFTQRYRNRLILERRVEIGGRMFAPYAMWEKFYDASVDAWVRTRYYAGVTIPINPRDSFQLYYLHEQNKYSFDKNVVGVSFLLSYRGAQVPHQHE